ncbi:MAG: nitrilase-related carbon-nitrogen hydrolase [Litorimonas sp.]
MTDKAAPDPARSTDVQLVSPDGSYETVPLEKEVITLKVLQTAVKNLSDYPTVEEGLQQNLAHMEAMADEACSTGSKPDILLYHEFPLTGYSSGTRTEKLQYTVQMPGPETEFLGEIARDCDTYIIFGSYATDPDWPGHILSLNGVIDTDGILVERYWKTRNIKRLYPDREITTTTIESVRDRYRDMYGPEAEFPVVKTEFGNIAVSTVQFDPFVFAAFSMRGAEILLRTATLFADYDVMATAAQNNVYSAMANIAFDIPGYEAGESLIVDNWGKVLAKSESKTEDDIIEAQIPIAAFREGRRIPNFALAVTMPVIEQYVQEFPLNHMDVAREDLPETGAAMKALMERASRFNSEAQKAEWAGR